MVKKFINWVARTKLRATVREMERTLKKMERLYNNFHTISL
jgi:hypothetical protein